MTSMPFYVSPEQLMKDRADYARKGIARGRSVVVLGYVLSIWMLTLVVKDIPVSVAYAVWAGLGTAGVAVVGVTLLGESFTVVKAGAIALIVSGVALLNLSGAAHH